MVSLSQHYNMSSGARFLVDNPTIAEDDRHHLVDPYLCAQSRSQFTPLNTIPIFSFHVLISTAISLTGVILAFLWTDEKRCEAYFIMLYLRAAFWLITFIFDHITKHHHENLRLAGHHEFHRSTAVHRGIPLYVVSLWNTVVLIIETYMQHFYGSNFGEHCIQSIFSPIVYITSFCVLENLVLLLVNGNYIVRVRNFNTLAPPPDALCRSNFGESGSIGLMQPGSNITDLLERQADLINYLKDHNAKLNQKLMQLNNQIRTITVQQHTTY